MVGASERDNEQELLEAIKGTFAGNDMTLIGEGYHEIMEGKAQVADGGLLAKGIFFTAEQARPALSFREAHPHMIHEIPVSKVYQTKIGPVLISGRLDGQEGRESEDKKLKFRNIDWQDYIDSYQWRYYLDMIETDIFYYDLFEVKGFDALRPPLPYLLPGVSFHAHERLQCIRYREMTRDCLSMLNDFIDYLELRQLWHLVKQVPDLQPAA